MFSHVTFGTHNLERAIAFYDATLAPLGIERVSKKYPNWAAWQGKGIGRRLMDAAEKHARDARLPYLELDTRIELVENHKAFAAMGFVSAAERAHAGYDRPTSLPCASN